MFSINSCIYKGEHTYHRPLVPKNLQRLADWIIEEQGRILQLTNNSSSSQFIRDVGRRRAYLNFHICTCNHNEFKTFHKFQGILSQLFKFFVERNTGRAAILRKLFIFFFFAVHEYIWENINECKYQIIQRERHDCLKEII